MAGNIDTVKRLNQACMDKDFETMKSFLHPDFTFSDPLMSFDNPKDYVEFMSNCPFEGTLENVSFLEDGDRVIQIVDCRMTSPEAFTIRMCDILTFRDGKIVKEEAIFDTAQMPESAKEPGNLYNRGKKAA